MAGQNPIDREILNWIKKALASTNPEKVDAAIQLVGSMQDENAKKELGSLLLGAYKKSDGSSKAYLLREMANTKVSPQNAHEILTSTLKENTPAVLNASVTFIRKENLQTQDAKQLLSYITKNTKDPNLKHSAQIQLEFLASRGGVRR